MAVYDVSGTQEDCYPNTTVLINRFDIRNQKQFSLVEQKLVTGLAAQLEQEVTFENVDFAFYKGLHKALFGDRLGRNSSDNHNLQERHSILPC